MNDSTEQPSLGRARLQVTMQQQVVRQLRFEGKEVGPAARLLETYQEIVRVLTSK